MTDKPTCHVEIINPDDILVVGVNNKWFRTFTSSSDRYPIRLEIPAPFLLNGWNLVTANYTNVPLIGKNDSNVEYKVLLDGEEVVHVTYKTEVEAQAFSLTFKDTFSLSAREIDRGTTGRKASKRFKDLMSWGDDQPPPLPPSAGGEEPPPPPRPGPSGRRIGG